MSNALDEPRGFNMDLLRRNHFCAGKKKGNEYVCDGEVDNSGMVDNAVDLLAEAVGRMRRWRVWDPWWVVEWMDEWLMARDRLEVQLSGRYSNEVVNDILGLIDKFVSYNEKLWNYWHGVGNEVKELVEELIGGRAEVIIRPSGVGVHSEHVTLEVNRTNTSMPVQLVLKGLESMTIKVSNVFRKTMSREEYEKFIKKMLKALKGGFEETDGTIDKGYAAMSTSQPWQAIAWTLLYPGEVRMYISAVNVNESDVTITWYLRSSHKPLKGKILNDVDELSEEGLLALMFTAILGDGSARIMNNSNGKAIIKITMSSEKFDAWKFIFERLQNKFRWRKYPKTNDADDIVFYSGYAIGLARAMINTLPPILRDVLDALGFEKWERIKRIAEMEVKFRRGEMQIIVAGYKFTVDIQKGTVVLVHTVRTEDEAKNVIEALKTVYGNEFHTHVNSHGKRLAVKIPMHVFRRYSDIKEQVIEVLRRKLEKTKDEKKKRIITKHLIRLTTPTEEAAAVLDSTNLSRDEVGVPDPRQ